MRRAVVAAAALLLAGCGEPGTPAHVAARPCLVKAGMVLDHGRTPNLPFLSPYDPNLGRMPSPATFRRDLELSFGSVETGANDVRLFFFDGEDAAARSESRIRKGSLRRYRFMRRGIAYVPGAVLDRDGAVLILWSSAPTKAQRTVLLGCLG